MPFSFSSEKEYINLYECRDDFYATVLDILSEDSTNDRANQIIDAFDYLPTADVAPVKHGHWIYENFYTHWSVCGKMAIYDKYGQEVESDYCPRCGAKMGGEGE